MVLGIPQFTVYMSSNAPFDIDFHPLLGYIIYDLIQAVFCPRLLQFNCFLYYFSCLQAAFLSSVQILWLLSSDKFPDSVFRFPLDKWALAYRHPIMCIRVTLLPLEQVQADSTLHLGKGRHPQASRTIFQAAFSWVSTCPVTETLNCFLDIWGSWLWQLILSILT